MKDIWTKEKYDNYVNDLKKLQDLKYLEFNKGITPNAKEMIGVRMPLLKKKAREISKSDVASFINYYRGEYFEETMMLGLVIGYTLNINISTYKDDNPIKVGLYVDEYLSKEYTTTKTNMQDITVFNIYYTNKEKLENNYIKYNFNKYYNEYENIDKYKIGYIISFTVDNKIYKEQILDPNSTFIFSPYIYIYLYDDINQPDGAWYSHILPEEVTDNTIYSSIKLFKADNISNITSPITLSVFTYDEDDFDSNNNYIGSSIYTITINLE